MNIKALVAVNHRAMLEAVCRLLRANREIGEVDAAATGAQAIVMSRAQPWDAVVLDVALPLVDGLTVLTTIKREQPTLAVVMLSMHIVRPMVERCLAAGANAFVSMESADEELMMAIRCALIDYPYLCRMVRANLAC